MEDTSKVKVRLDSENIKQFSKQFCMMLMSSPDPIPKQKISEDLGLTSGQMSAVVKYMRRCSEANLEKYIRYYPISSKHGYTLPKSWEDFLPCFSTLYCWANSIMRTIDPMREKMEKEGIDIAEYMKQQGKVSDLTDKYLEGMVIDQETSWFYEED